MNRLIKKKISITTAESCTGGLLSGTLINVAGVSEVLNEAHVTYSNEAKERVLGVSHETLENFGAVSPQTAKEMAVGAAKTGKAEVALATTGIAGPDGGTLEKPVGLVYIGCFVQGRVFVKECHFTGSRRLIRENSVKEALAFLLEHL